LGGPKGAPYEKFENKSHQLTAVQYSLGYDIHSYDSFLTCDLSASFPLQMVSFQDSMQGEIAKVKNVKQLAHMLIIENASVSSGFADVVTALILFLTIPVSVATAERSFSKLKIIKSYLRNSMGQTRLRGLSLLAIEASRAKSMDIAQLIDRFAQMKARRIRL
jgi:hypothetical protein